MSEDKDKNLVTRSSKHEIQKFVKKARSPAIKEQRDSGRLVFGLDATASRQATWDCACDIQGSMFEATRDIGGLNIQLCYYRGFNEFAATPWLKETRQLHRKMNSVSCVGGYTQIARLLRHTLNENASAKVNALVLVSDAMEEKVDELCDLAGKLGLMRVPIFAFQENDDPIATHAYQQMAYLSGGAYSTFDANSANKLADLLRAVAVYASGGKKALENFNKQLKSEAVKQLTHQLKG